MFPLRCTVRNCARSLRLIESSLGCDAGHRFDRAREGYWSLLQPQDRRSLRPGDSDEAVLARHRWLQRGHSDGLVESLRPWIDRSAVDDAEQPIRTLDLGCGEGTFGRSLFSKEADGFCGIDLSKKAVKIAARAWPDATWVLANADRGLPVADDSLHRVISLFGRRPATEIFRALVPGGFCIVAVPGEDDLIELREQVQRAGHRRRRSELVAEELASVGLECVEQDRWKHQVELEPDALVDALAMTYRAARHSQKTRVESLTRMTVTLAADLLLLRRPR